MKNEEIKALTVEELTEKMASEKEALTKLKFSHAISQIENPTQINTSRKLIARLATELTAKKKTA